jgi:hypothetical protein
VINSKFAFLILAVRPCKRDARNHSELFDIAPREHRSRLAALFAFGVLLGFSSPAIGDDLDKLISQVEEQELLYENIEFVVERDYRLVDSPARQEKDFPGKVITKSHTTLRHIYQEKSVYVSLDADRSWVNGDSGMRKVIHAYDGRKYTHLQQKVVNIHFEPQHIIDSRYPHTLIMDRAGVSFPLSEYLKRNTKMYPKYKTAVMRVTLAGQESVKQQRCVKVRVDVWFDGQTAGNPSVRYLWLAIDRNYLPVRTEAYSRASGLKWPVEVGEIDEMREVEAGIWFPSRIAITVFRDPESRKVENVTEFKTTKISLNPNYDKAFFSEIPIPADAFVYEVKNGKAIKSLKRPAK